MKIKKKEYWYLACVDEFELFHGENLTSKEYKEVDRLREKACDQNTSNPDEYYINAIEILHKAFCRTNKCKKCVLEEGEKEYIYVTKCYE